MGDEGVYKLVFETVGLNIAGLREGAGITQDQLAQMAATNRSYISNIENGQKNPSLKKLALIASALGVPLPELFTGLEGSPPHGLTPESITYRAIKL